MNFRGSTKRSKGRNSTAKFRGDLWYGQRPVMIPRWWGKRGGLQTGLPWLKMSEVNGYWVAEYYEMVSYGLQGQQSGWPENGSETSLKRSVSSLNRRFLLSSQQTFENDVPCLRQRHGRKHHWLPHRPKQFGRCVIEQSVFRAGSRPSCAVVAATCCYW